MSEDKSLYDKDRRKNLRPEDTDRRENARPAGRMKALKIMAILSALIIGLFILFLINPKV